MKVKVKYTNYPTVFVTKDFTIVVVTPCLSDTLTVDATKFASPVSTYIIKYTATDFTWTDINVASFKNLIATCGALTWTVKKTDGVTAIDSTVFTGDYTSATKTISTYTTDFTKAGNY